MTNMGHQKTHYLGLCESYFVPRAGGGRRVLRGSAKLGGLLCIHWTGKSSSLHRSRARSKTSGARLRRARNGEWTLAARRRCQTSGSWSLHRRGWRAKPRWRHRSRKDASRADYSAASACSSLIRRSTMQKSETKCAYLFKNQRNLMGYIVMESHWSRVDTKRPSYVHQLRANGTP